MENLAIQMMGLSVIAKVQAKHVVAIGEQARAGVQHVTRLHAAFPAMQENDESARPRLNALPRMQAKQAYAVAAIQQVLGGAPFQHEQAAAEKHPAHTAGGKY